MEEKRNKSAAGIFQKILSVLLTAAGAAVGISWWQMPYLHHSWYGEDLNVLLHIAVFLLCPVLCLLTFRFAEKNRKLCIAAGIAELALVIIATLVNSGFVPNTGTLIIGLLVILYLIAAFMGSRPEKPETESPKALVKKFKKARLMTVITSAAALFSIVFPKGKQVFSQHMGPDGPGVIEYYYQYTDFGIILICLIPIFLILLVIFAIRTAQLHRRIQNAGTDTERLKMK